MNITDLEVRIYPKVVVDALSIEVDGDACVEIRSYGIRNILWFMTCYTDVQVTDPGWRLIALQKAIDKREEELPDAPQYRLCDPVYRTLLLQRKYVRGCILADKMISISKALGWPLDAFGEKVESPEGKKAAGLLQGAVTVEGHVCFDGGVACRVLVASEEVPKIGARGLTCVDEIAAEARRRWAALLGKASGVYITNPGGKVLVYDYSYAEPSRGGYCVPSRAIRDGLSPLENAVLEAYEKGYVVAIDPSVPPFVGTDPVTDRVASIYKASIVAYEDNDVKGSGRYAAKDYLGTSAQPYAEFHKAMFEHFDIPAEEAP